MQVDGLVEGKINSENTLVISASGRVKGEVSAEKVIINGSFDGELYAHSVEILPSGRASGVIHSNDLTIEKGGSFRGETQPVAEEKLLQHEDDADDNAELRLENKTE
ncbi:bactofilin family protein [Arsukibacterium sp.]|uniref:bactofilin family protein n=1 Tax=Arsukibacterium sp. TaxID=1977258 RepID=UPI002FD9CB26